MKAYDQYKKVEIPDGTHIEACPVCASAAELWRFSEDADADTSTAVMCANGEAIGPQVTAGMEVHAGCLLYMPPQEFYQGTIREAVKYWNAYATALQSQRREAMGNRKGTERKP